MSSEKSMNFIEVSPTGADRELRLGRMEIPRPCTGEVLIRVLSAGVNRPDVLQRMGVYPPPVDANPILGLEVAGEIIQTGEDVDTFRPGEKVCALTNGGGYAQYCCVPAGQCLPWPQSYDALHAAALPETYFTVWVNLFQIGHLVAGETLLVHGGSGGIGMTAIQLAKEYGARVYASAGSAVKCEACLKIGADAAMDYHQGDFGEWVMQISQGKGVDVILDIVGAAYTLRNLNCLAVDGRLLQVGLLMGAKVDGLDLMKIMSRRLTISGSTLRARSTSEKAAIASALYASLWPVLNAGRCAPLIYKVFPLEDAELAHRYMLSGEHIGKIMLEVNHE